MENTVANSNNSSHNNSHSNGSANNHSSKNTSTFNSHNNSVHNDSNNHVAEASNSAALLPQLETIERMMKLPVVEAAWNQGQDVYGKVKGELDTQNNSKLNAKIHNVCAIAHIAKCVVVAEYATIANGVHIFHDAAFTSWLFYAIFEGFVCLCV